MFGPSLIVNSVNAVIYQNTLKPLEYNNTVIKTMATKIAKSGLNYEYLKRAFERNGFGGLAAVLGEKLNGVVRVTKHGKTIQKIYEHFSLQLSQLLRIIPFLN